MEKSPNLPSSLTSWRKLAIAAATGCWVGFVPWAPGTFGSLAALPLAFANSRIGLPLVEAAIVVVACAAGIPLVNAALAGLGRGKDPGCIVFDEVAGILITFLFIPATNWLTLAAGFAFFRLFDISKLPPARQLERWPGGLGVMADDWIAGLYANLSLRAMMWVTPGWFA